MRLTHAPAQAAAQAVPLLAVLVDESRPKTLPGGALGKRAAGLMAQGAFKGEKGKSLLLHAERPGGARALLLLGLGKTKEVTTRDLRAAGATLVARAAEQSARSIVATAAGKLSFDAAGLAAFAQGLVLGSYRYPLKKDESPPPTQVKIVADVKGAKDLLRQALAVSEGSNLARKLGDLPGNVATPTHLKRTAQALCKAGGLRFKAYDRKALERMKMGGILAVGRASAEPPWLLELDYRPPRAKHTVCVVGKGLTFDSGGISIKPSGGMEEMKYDMCGGAATLGLMQVVAATKPKGVRVVGIVGTVENMPGGAAYKPGDVVTTASGKTIEVVNTDAEGRVVLADALHHATSFDPDAIVDMATLTGAIVVALGHEAAGLFCPDDKLAKRLLAASERSGEAVWRMPTYPAYSEKVKSQWADIKNSAGREGGACTAAAFLANFTEGFAHAHLDIAGSAWEMRKRDGLPEGARGFGVRLLHDALMHWND